MNTDLKLFETLSISSEMEQLSRAESLIDKVCNTFQVNDDYYGNILIAVTEAVNNAIIHGNKQDSSKTVNITVAKGIDQFEVMVEDQGAGFDLEALPDPTAPENLEKENGRGIFLMKNLAEQVEFEDSGRKVILRFNIN
jgi:serine/threonine-protein kinase RsbW